MKNSSLSFEDLSLEEQTAVTQLKQRMIGYLDQNMFDDLSMFVRFLRARSLDVNAAESMLKNHIEWRKMMQIDTILTNYSPKEVQQKYITMNSLGFGKEGHPIIFLNLGNMDTRGVLKAMRKVDVTKYIIRVLETNVQFMKEQSLKLSRHIDQWIVIINFDGFPFAVATHKPTLEVIAHTIMMYDSNYPERLKAAYLINCSMYFTMGFAVIKHAISASTYRKIKMFGKDGWKEELLQAVDPEVLPAFLGGDRTDSDGNPLCHEVITHGGTVPRKFYINKKENSLMNIPGVQKLTVTRLSKNHVTFNIKEPGVYLEWEFETKSRDIEFSLLYKKNEFDSRIKILIPKQRIETNLSSETGTFKCEDLGIYIIEFDNSYSWMRQKEIYYKVSVTKNLLS